MVKKASNPNKEYRSFVIQGSSLGYEGGHFVSASPSGAAKKASRKLFALVEKDSDYKRYKSEEVIQFILRETTTGSAHKTYPYDARKEHLKTPIELPIKDKNGNPLLVHTLYKAIPLKEQEVHSYLVPKLNNNAVKRP
jgi:hypothetical protein